MIMPIIEQMYDSFADLDHIFKKFPKEVEDLIFDYAYGFDRDHIHQLSCKARSASYRMPVPRAWRYLVDDTNIFRWDIFLSDPQTILIDVDAVKETLNLMNWNAVRVKTNALSHYIKTTTKRSIMCMLDNPISCLNPQTMSTAVHMVWHILTCCEPQDFKVEAHKNDRYNRFCFIPYFNRPLSAYLLPNARWTGWDEVAHRHYHYPEWLHVLNLLADLFEVFQNALMLIGD